MTPTQAENPISETRFLTPAEAARLLRMTGHALACRRSRGNGPPYIKIGGLIRYTIADLERWVERHTRTCVRDAGGGI